MADGNQHFVIIERQWSKGLAVAYPSEAEAIKALTESPLIDGLCEEDALDCYTSETVPDWAEIVLPPKED